MIVAVVIVLLIATVIAINVLDASGPPPVSSTSTGIA